MLTGEDKGPGFGLPNVQAKVDGISGLGGPKWPFGKNKKPGRPSTKRNLLKEIQKELKATGSSFSSKVTSSWEGLSEKVHAQTDKVKNLASRSGVCLEKIPDVELAIDKASVENFFQKIKDWLQAHLQDAGRVLFPCCCGRHGSYDITPPNEGVEEDPGLEKDLEKAADDIKKAASTGDPSFKENVNKALDVLKRAVKSAKNKNAKNRQSQKLRSTVDVGVQCVCLDCPSLRNQDSCSGTEVYWSCQSSSNGLPDEPIYENITPWGEPWGNILTAGWCRNDVDIYTEGNSNGPLQNGMIRCKLPTVADVSNLAEKERLLEMKLAMVDQTLKDLNVMWQRAEQELDAAIAERRRIENSRLSRRIRVGLRRLFYCFCPPKGEE